MGRRSPQEKKALSYAKDRRNMYGEHDKGSRKTVRRNKQAPNRSDRHREHQVLSASTGLGMTAGDAERAELRLLAKKSMWFTKRWRKCPDAPLADAVEYRLWRRARLGIDDPASAAAKMERLNRRRRASGWMWQLPGRSGR